MSLVVYRSVQVWISTQHAGLDKISQYVDPVGFGQSNLFAGRLPYETTVPAVS